MGDEELLLKARRSPHGWRPRQLIKLLESFEFTCSEGRDQTICRHRGEPDMLPGGDRDRTLKKREKLHHGASGHPPTRTAPAAQGGRALRARAHGTRATGRSAHSAAPATSPPTLLQPAMRRAPPGPM
jgi:hypothetical protein